MENLITPVILAGGSGSRLWPLSRSTYPKQLLPLVSSHTLLQESLLRTQLLGQTARPIIICNQEHRFLILEQLQQIGIEADIILEPQGKNTAPAVALAAFHSLQTRPNTTLLVLPADHVIEQNDAFIAAIQRGQFYATQDHLVTFGIVPTQPETGYGYIKTSAALGMQGGYQVAQFVEKPDLSTATAYVKSGQYYWNSGMFMFNTIHFLKELSQHAPDIAQICEQVMQQTSRDSNFIHLKSNLFATVPPISLDYALMEKTQQAVLIPLQSTWSDVGSWSALWEKQPLDAAGNVTQGDVVLEQVKNSYLRAESRMLAVVGVSDHIIIETPDVVLVTHKDQCQHVKTVVERLKQAKRPEVDLHRKVCRPWGYYENIDKGQNFQVKRICVKPGASLSLQMHKHRSEHWVIVKGTAHVTRGDEQFVLTENQSTYIPCGVKHRLYNAGQGNLEIIEIQSGSYLGEDDIVRYEDNYGRVEA